MKVTVITVAFNSVGTIRQTLESIAAQSYRDIEHIIVDGGSSDGTIELIEAYKGVASILVSEPDDGIYDAMNKGVLMATGDVIGFLNSDDRFADVDVVTRIADAFAKGDFGAVFADVLFTADSQEASFKRRYSSSRFRPDRIGWGWMPAHPTLYLRREVFQEYGLFKTDYRIAGDYELVARIMHKNTVSYHYCADVWVVMKAGGVSTSGLRSTLLLNREVLRACRENGIPTSWFMLLSKYPLKLMEYFRKCPR